MRIVRWATTTYRAKSLINIDRRSIVVSGTGISRFRYHGKTGSGSGTHGPVPVLVSNDFTLAGGKMDQIQIFCFVFYDNIMMFYNQLLMSE